MKIDASAIRMLSTYATAAKFNPTVGTKKAGPKDSIEVSSDGQLFSEIIKEMRISMNAQRTVSAEKLSELKQKIQNGDYNVNSMAVAEKIMMEA